MNKLYLVVLLLATSLGALAQKTGISGRVVDADTNYPIPGVTVSVVGTPQIKYSQVDGTFMLDAPGGQTVTVSFSDGNYLPNSMEVNTNPEGVTQVGDVKLTVSPLSQQEIPTIAISDIDNGAESGLGSQTILGLLTTASDVYLSETAYNFGAVRFFVRGLDNEYTHAYINGVNFNDAERGRFNYSMLGGLNDATRNKDMTNGMLPSSFGFGDLGGVSHIDTRASSYAKGGKLTTSYTNRSYKLRGALTYSTGLMDNGWAVTGSVAYRWADEGFVDGTFYNSLGYLLAVEKVFGRNRQHSLSLTTLGAPTLRGQQGASTQEVYDLSGIYYNPYWGWQNGQKRNSREVNAYDPMAVLSHTWKISKQTKLVSGFGARYSQYGSTALNWYNSADPRPDYYRYLPSYQTDQQLKELVANEWLTNANKRQIDWDALYLANYNANQKDSSARYIQEERVNNQLELIANSTFSAKPTSNQAITAGVEVRATRGYHFKRMNDLLGANYWLDRDQFAERDFRGNPDMKQNDLNNPDRKIHEGDKFGYNYNMDVTMANLWFQNQYMLPKLDLFYAAKLSYTGFQREGLMRNGRAPDNSFGKGEVHEFVNQAFKGGMTYKITGRHFVSANGLYETRAPLPNNAYLSPRIMDKAIPELQSERVASADVNYMFSTRWLSGRVSAFQTNFYDQSETSSFYHDAYSTFVNYVLADIRKTHRGFELGAKANLTSRLTLTAVGTVAEYRYRNRPTGHINYENGSRPDTTETVYLKNFFVGGTPQTAGSVGLHYFHRKYWFFDVNYNYFDRNYVDLSPVRRTAGVVDFIASSQEEREEKVKTIIDQEKYKAGGTLDLSVGKSMRIIDRKYTLNVNLSVSNVLDNKELRTGGYEQGRFDYDTYNVSKYPSKYYYSQGRNFFLNVGLRF